MLRLQLALERWPLIQPFSISRYTYHDSLIATARLVHGDSTGTGECEPHGWDEAHARALVSDVGLAIDDSSAVPPWLDGLTRDNIGERMARSPLRNAVDCALWDLDAKSLGRPAYELAGSSWEPLPVLMTIGIDTPDAMASIARSMVGAYWVKVKLGRNDGLDVARLEAVAAELPGIPLLLDPNGGWDPGTLAAMLPLASRLGVRVIEQPMVPELDAYMPAPPDGMRFFADESCLDRASLDRIAPHFQGINIKLDKAGGLTEALALRSAATARGLDVMVGMMSGTSLAVAPGFLLAQGLDVVDLEVGFLREDRNPPIRIVDFRMQPPDRALWG